MALAQRQLAMIDALLWYSIEAGRLVTILTAARDSEDPAQIDAALAEGARADAQFQEMWAFAEAVFEARREMRANAASVFATLRVGGE